MRLFKKNKIFIIAELANSHEGKLSLAKKITENAANVNPKNSKSIKFFKKNRYKLLQHTYELRK